MNLLSLTKSSLKTPLSHLFSDMGYIRIYGPDIERDYHPLSLFLMNVFECQIETINPKAKRNAIEEAKTKILHSEHGMLVHKTKSLLIICKME